MLSIIQPFRSDRLIRFHTDLKWSHIFTSNAQIAYNNIHLSFFSVSLPLSLFLALASVLWNSFNSKKNIRLFYSTMYFQLNTLDFPILSCFFFSSTWIHHERWIFIISPLFLCAQLVVKKKEEPFQQIAFLSVWTQKKEKSIFFSHNFNQ